MWIAAEARLDAQFHWRVNERRELKVQLSFEGIVFNRKSLYRWGLKENPVQTFIKIVCRSDYPCYRDYVIVALPQLDSLDGQEITRTERLKAKQKFEENRREVIQLQVNKWVFLFVYPARQHDGRNFYLIESRSKTFSLSSNCHAFFFHVSSRCF